MQYDVTQYSAENNELRLIGPELPLVKLLLSQEQVQIILNKMPNFLKQYEQKQHQNIGRFRSAGSVNQRLREARQIYDTIKKDWSSTGVLNKQKASRLYDEVASILEFIMKEIAYKDGLTFLEEVYKNNNKAKNSTLFKNQLKGFFIMHFSFEPSVIKADFPNDILGINEEGTLYSYYIFAGYDVLYNYPKMFKTDGVPGFVLNLAYDLQQTQSLGQTKQKMTAFALERVMEGLGLKEIENTLFSYRSNPLFQIDVSEYSLPLIKGRYRYIVHTVNTTFSSNQMGDFIALKYDELTSNELDKFYVPITAIIIKDMQQLKVFVNEIEDNKNYYELLVNQFIKKYESGEK